MGSQINILHVEDDPNDALLFQHACQKAGVSFKLQAVNDGDQAIDYLRGLDEFGDRRKHPFPQLVLLDLKMQRMTGFDVLEWLQQHAEFKTFPVVVLTSSDQESDRKRALRLGAAEYCVKPGGIQKLTELVQQIRERWLKS